MNAIKLVVPIVVVITAVTTMNGQQAYVDARPHEIMGNIERTAKVIDYRTASGSTKIDFRGTSLLPDARGEATIQRKLDHIQINAEFAALQSATRFGPEYLTYVLWAITPEGSATNLGEVVRNGANSKSDITTEHFLFGLIVTAEPYFAVSQPSEIVVMENVFTKGWTGNEPADANYELLPCGSYTRNVSRSQLKRIVVEPSTPLDLYEARNALWIALWAGAEKDAAELFSRAERSLQRAEAFHASRAGATSVLTAAREAVRMAENARVLALKRRSDALSQEDSVGVDRQSVRN